MLRGYNLKKVRISAKRLIGFDISTNHKVLNGMFLLYVSQQCLNNANQGTTKDIFLFSASREDLGEFLNFETST